MKIKRKRGINLVVLVISLIFVFLITDSISIGGVKNVKAESSDIHEQIEDINKQVSQKKEEVKTLDNKINHFKSLISDKKLESAELSNQTILIESKIAKTKVSIDIAEQEIASLELQLSRLDNRIIEANSKIDKERNLLSLLSRRLYKKQLNQSMLQIMLSHKTFSGFFEEMYAIASLQRQVDTSLNKIFDLRKELENERSLREDKRNAVSKRKLEIEIEHRKLEDELAFRETLLIETKSSELEYRYMLADLQREQNEADYDIYRLEKALREKIDLSDKVASGPTILSWPIEPARGISSIFHDPDYPFKHIFQHSGIDIRAYQGTPVRAAASGIVGRAKNAGLGYSYILLIHNNNISTVYGHISKIVVKEDTFVERGEIIGYSGGMPGTAGAGRLTTGPHLHFETRLKGIPVDPLAYLVAR